MLQGADTATHRTGQVNADLAALDEVALSDVIVDCHRAIARLQGRQLRAIAALDRSRAGTPLADFVAGEVAFDLHVTDGYASSLLGLARTLTRRLPATFAALECGDIDAYKAGAVAEYTEVLDDAAAGAVENAVLGKAPTQTATELKRTLNREIHKADPQAAAKRRERAERHRDVKTGTESDGMASLYAYLTAEGAAMVMLVLDGLARAARSEPGETRTLAELRADKLVEIFRSILESGSFGGQPMQTRQGSKPHLHVTIDALTLLGLANNPGYLAGYGPIPAEVARELAEDAGTWRRIITDPVTRELLDYGTNRYRPGKVLAQHVITRDRVCPWPGCTRPAASNDLDHTIPFPHGPTAHWNLGAPCRHHHRAKHAGFTVEQTTPGTFEWRSPTGRLRTVHAAQLGVPNPAADGWDVPANAWLARINDELEQPADLVDPFILEAEAEADRLVAAGVLPHIEDVVDYWVVHGPPDDAVA